MPEHTCMIITGPTATGKTALGVMAAKTLNGEVVSADSMQVYRHMDIGTAKPKPGEMAGVPHHMLDAVSPLEDYSVSRYVGEASRYVDDILSRSKLPVIVGGTGLYIDSLTSGRVFSLRGQAGLREELAARYDAMGGEAMLREMKAFDPERAAKLHANDKKRIVRAFEIHETSGTTISQHDIETQKLPARYSALKIALTFSDRETLYARINARVDDMIAAGLINEVLALLDMGVSPDCTAMQAIGYKEIIGALQGEYSMDEAAEMIKVRSRHYAKRQLTWLRRDESVKWIRWGKEPDLDAGLARINEIISDAGDMTTTEDSACEKAISM